MPATRGDYATVERRAHDCKYTRAASDSIQTFGLIPYRRQAADFIHGFAVILKVAIPPNSLTFRASELTRFRFCVIIAARKAVQLYGALVLD